MWNKSSSSSSSSRQCITHGTVYTGGWGCCEGDKISRWTYIRACTTLPEGHKQQTLRSRLLWMNATTCHGEKWISDNKKKKNVGRRTLPFNLERKEKKMHDKSYFARAKSRSTWETSPRVFIAFNCYFHSRTETCIIFFWTNYLTTVRVLWRGGRKKKKEAIMAEIKMV